MRGRDALRVRVPPALGVALGRDEDVLAHGMQPLVAERAAVGGGLRVLRAAHDPPARLGRGRTGADRVSPAAHQPPWRTRNPPSRAPTTPTASRARLSRSTFCRAASPSTTTRRGVARRAP